MKFPKAGQLYQSFRDGVFQNAISIVREPVDFFPDLTEIELQAKWFAGEYGREFSGEDGKRIEIVQFGHWNRGAGPDFTETAIRIDGELHTGAIEIDMEAVDWEHHGHGTNPEFDKVILHVFLKAPISGDRFFTRTSEHREIPQLKLTPDPGPAPPASRYPPEAFPGRCVTPLADMKDDAVESLLLGAAQSRLREKSARLMAMANNRNQSQALFQGIAEALGFRQNQTPMALLSQRCSITDLRSFSPINREAMLFGVAGFLDPNQREIPADSSEYIRSLWESWWKMRAGFEPSAVRAIPWQLSRSRPMNHPQRRVAALATLTNQWKRFAQIWEKPEAETERRFVRLCTDLRHDYWNHHYTVQSKAAPKPMQLIGRARQRDILGNVIFPWIVAKQPTFWQDYEKMAGSDINEKTRRALLRLFGEDEKRARAFSRKYYQQQGLLAVYRDFCLIDASECKDCVFPEQLVQWGGT